MMQRLAQLLLLLLLLLEAVVHSRDRLLRVYHIDASAAAAVAADAAATSALGWPSSAVEFYEK